MIFILLYPYHYIDLALYPYHDIDLALYPYRDIDLASVAEPKLFIQLRLRLSKCFRSGSSAGFGFDLSFVRPVFTAFK
jgi:hypothetical protein